MREPTATDTTFRVDNDAGHQLLEVTHLPLFRRMFAVDTGEGGCLLERQQAVALAAWLLPRALADRDFLPAQLYRCGECARTSSDDAWSAAWWTERSRRINDPKYAPEPGEPPHATTHDYGLSDRMVCPRCRYVHADDDCSWVEEIAGLAIEIPQASRNGTAASGGDRG